MFVRITKKVPIRGHFPAPCHILSRCPVCHVPKDQLHDSAESWPYHTGLETQKLVAEAQALNAAKGEEILKANSIQPVDVR